MADEELAKQKLQAALPSGLEIDFDALFPKLTGFGAARANKARAKRLSNSAEVLRRFLDPDEKIRYVAAGVVNLGWEAVFIGWMSYYINATTLVVTDRRVLLIHTDSKGNPRAYVNQVRLENIKKISKGILFGFLKLKLGKGSISFTRIKGAETKIIRKMLTVNKAATGGKEFVCPACGAPSTVHDTRCLACGGDVKSPKKAALKSLVLPGLGDYYLGHRVLALLEMFGSGVGWLLLAGAAVGVLTGDEGAGVAFVLWLTVVGLGHAMDAAVTYAQGRKGMYSLDDKLPTTAREKLLVPDASGGRSTPVAMR